MVDVVTKTRLHELIDALPEAERATAARFLEHLLREQGWSMVSGAAFFDASHSQVVLRPDVPPIQSIDALRGDFWPDDEQPDEFIDAIRAWRREGNRA
jgi:hypothetical protein